MNENEKKLRLFMKDHVEKEQDGTITLDIYKYFNRLNLLDEV